LEPTLARSLDRPDLESLWELVFHDDLDTIRNFLNFAATEDNTVVVRQDGRVVAMAFLLPCAVCLPNGSTHHAYYFYAAATHPDYREQGHMGRILRFCKDLAAERGADFLLLVPAEPHLYKYYGRFGFQSCIARTRITCTRDELLQLSFPATPVSGSGTPDHADIRRAAFAGLPFVDWNRSLLKYLFFDHASAGGKIASTEDGYALYREPEEGTVYVQEFCPGTHPVKLLHTLADTGADTYLLDLPAGTSVKAKRSATGRIGMAAPLNEEAKALQGQLKNLYIGFTLG